MMLNFLLIFLGLIIAELWEIARVFGEKSGIMGFLWDYGRWCGV